MLVSAYIASSFKMSSLHAHINKDPGSSSADREAGMVPGFQQRFQHAQSHAQSHVTHRMFVCLACRSMRLRKLQILAVRRGEMTWTGSSKQSWRR